ncbi:MAG: imidazoleglycerol-phosphate dehydratase HisB, partial [Ruminococcaceae bacterium]|nr:imidazoleglycerol-phosphate dehydratase HisB [Oscillospiraceae bacterium]
MRTCTRNRNTSETKISLSLTLEGKGKANIQTGCGFFDHMLTLFASHGRFDLTILCDGDHDVDDHHTVEDVGILLGASFRECLGDCRGIRRYSSLVLPMDEALVLSALDISGRGYLGFDCLFPTEKVGTFDTELIKEFFLAFVREAELTLHLRKLAGENSHHIAEALFKATARTLREAVAIDPTLAEEIPSTKGVLL